MLNRNLIINLICVQEFVLELSCDKLPWRSSSMEIIFHVDIFHRGHLQPKSSFMDVIFHLFKIVFRSTWHDIWLFSTPHKTPSVMRSRHKTNFNDMIHWRGDIRRTWYGMFLALAWAGSPLSHFGPFFFSSLLLSTNFETKVTAFARDRVEQQH